MSVHHRDPLLLSVIKRASGQFELSNTNGPGWLENHDRDYFNVSGYWGQIGPHVFHAAPDMLDALEYAVEQYGKPGGPWSVPSDPGGWLDRARAAIAKARGQ